MADTWQITGQRQREILVPGTGQFRTVMEITYVITAGPAAGDYGTIQEPASSYNVDNVAADVQAAVELRSKVAAL